MEKFKVYTKKDAPEGSKNTLENIEKKYGFQPNLFGIFAESQAALNAYTSLSEIFSQSSFSATEQQIVLLSVSFENRCDYCMAAHSTVAKMSNVDESIIKALRKGEKIEDKKLEALHEFTRTVVSERGFVSEDTIKNFMDAGYSKEQALDVLVGVSLKTLSNYTNHMAKTPLDSAFKDMEWKAE